MKFVPCGDFDGHVNNCSDRGEAFVDEASCATALRDD
jgi:hypothetical protein